METATVNGVDIAYQLQGYGPPIVLLHGIIGDSREWRPQIEDLSRDFTVVAWNAPGCGQSSDPAETSSLEDYVDCLAGLLEFLGAMPAHITGLSWGGTFAQEFYRRRPELVRSLILADTYAGWRGSLPPEIVEERLASCMRESEMRPEEFVPKWIPGLLTDLASESLRREVTEIMSDFHPVGYRVMARALADVDTRDLLPEIRVPTLLIWGEDDRRAPVSVGKEMCDSIPGASIVVIPNAGHLSNVEQADQFNAAVREFCQSISN
ncbi:MAG: alpha/beta hydrolase [Dehalococcoidia bacterium]